MTKLIGITFLFVGALIGTVLTGPALAQQTQPAPTEAPSRMMSPSHQMHKAMIKMNSNMAKMKMTGDTDRDFAMMMTEHHRGAIEMAEIEVKHGKVARLKAMAKKMITMQKAEQAELLKHSKMSH